MPYEPKLPEGVSLPAGHSIDTSHADYRALEAMATKHGLSQAAFSDALGYELRRQQARAPAAPAAPPPAAKPDFSKMTTAQQFAHALAKGQGR